jgi:CBS domain-containing protein
MEKLRSIIRGRDTFALDQNWTVLEAARYMAEKGIGAAPVLDGDCVVGVFSERDLMKRVVVAGLPADRTTVAEVMTRQIVVGHPEENMETGLRRMQQAGCRHLPIVQDQHLLGFISLRDIMQIEIDEKDEEIKLMNEYVTGPLPRAI